MNPIRFCKDCSESLEPHGMEVTVFIDKDTTPEELDKKIASLAAYKFENGGRCGWNALGQAAHMGNVSLIQCIVEKGGKHLLNFGNEFGETPLLLVSLCKDKKAGFLAAQELVKLGAEVNLACKGLGGFPCGANSLWAALEKTEDLNLAVLLLNNGAIEPGNPKSHIPHPFSY